MAWFGPRGTDETCGCCQEPPCSYCADSTGPFSSVSYSCNISGFPSSITLNRSTNNIFAGFRYVETWEGLDACNGTRTISSNDEFCVYDSQLIEIPLTITQDIYGYRAGFDVFGNICTYSNFIQTVVKNEVCYLSLNSVGYTVGGGYLYTHWPPGHAITGGGKFTFNGNQILTNGCSSGSGSSSWTSFILCNFPSIFYNGTWTFTGVP